MKKRLEKQLEFDFYKEMKAEERYDNSIMRIYWDKRKSVGSNLAGWIPPIMGFVGLLYLIGKYGKP